MSPRPKKAALYVRVSTADQTMENPVTELERVAEFRGWRITNRYSDRGISGAKGRQRDAQVRWPGKVRRGHGVEPGQTWPVPHRPAPDR